MAPLNDRFRCVQEKGDERRIPISLCIMTRLRKARVASNIITSAARVALSHQHCPIEYGELANPTKKGPFSNFNTSTHAAKDSFHWDAGKWLSSLIPTSLHGSYGSVTSHLSPNYREVNAPFFFPRWTTGHFTLLAFPCEVHQLAIRVPR